MANEDNIIVFFVVVKGFCFLFVMMLGIESGGEDKRREIV